MFLFVYGTYELEIVFKIFFNLNYFKILNKKITIYFLKNSTDVYLTYYLLSINDCIMYVNCSKKSEKLQILENVAKIFS